MAANTYRDPHAGIRARIVELETRIREREAEVTREFWDSLDPDVRERMRSEREAFELVDATAGLEELARAEGLLASYLDELSALIARLPAMEAEWHELPDDVDDPPLPRHTWPFAGWISAEEWRGMKRSFLAVVREQDRHGTVAEDGDRTCIARFRTLGVPFALRASAQPSGNGTITEVDMCLVTSVPRAMPRLVVRHETLVLSVGSALGLTNEVEVGEPSFDGLFLIEGTQEAAAQILLPALRAQLLALARYDIPTLTIDPPRRIASLRWSFEPNATALDAAVRVLAAIRGTLPDVRFRAAAAE